MLVGEAGAVEDTRLRLDPLWAGGAPRGGGEAQDAPAPVARRSIVALLHTNIHSITTNMMLLRALLYISETG